MKKLKITAAASNKRLDLFVNQHLPMLSRASVQKLIDSGLITVNDRTAKASYKLRQADMVAINFDPETLERVSNLDLPVLYEDNDCVVINKPTGTLTHSKGGFNPEPTVATWLQKHLLGHDSEFLGSNPGNNREGIVHRLDRGTSGVLICAKNSASLAWLQKQFSQRRVVKTYMAVIKGSTVPGEAVIDMPIQRHPKKPQTFRVDPGGRPAVTQYRVIKTQGLYSLLELTPQTGRTHQLRVHLAKLGFPIVGDTVYGGEAAPRLLLHALELEITLPSKQRQVFRAPLPVDFAAYVQ